MAAVHIPLLLTLPDLSDMSHPSLPSLLTPIKNQVPVDSLSRDSSLRNCWAPGNWSFSSAHRRKTLSFVFYLYKNKRWAHQAGPLAHLSLCSAVGWTSHRGDWEIRLNDPFASCILWLRRFQSLEQHPCAYIFRPEFSLLQVDCSNHLLTQLLHSAHSWTGNIVIMVPWGLVFSLKNELYCYGLLPPLKRSRSEESGKDDKKDLHAL